MRSSDCKLGSQFRGRPLLQFRDEFLVLTGCVHLGSPLNSQYVVAPLEYVAWYGERETLLWVLPRPPLSLNRELVPIWWCRCLLMRHETAVSLPKDMTSNIKGDC
jgi:hypothetical protein